MSTNEERLAIRQQARDGRLPDMDWPLFMAEVAPRLDPLLRPLFDAMQERGDLVPQVTWRLRRSSGRPLEGSFFTRASALFGLDQYLRSYGPAQESYMLAAGFTLEPYVDLVGKAERIEWEPERTAGVRPTWVREHYRELWHLTLDGWTALCGSRIPGAPTISGPAPSRGACEECLRHERSAAQRVPIEGTLTITDARGQSFTIQPGAVNLTFGKLPEHNHDGPEEG